GGQVGAVRSAEEPLGGGGRPGGGRPGRLAVLQGREDAAPVVVDDHDGQVGDRLRGPDEQPVGVVQEGQVAHERDGAPGGGQRHPDGGGHGAVDPGQTAGGDDPGGGTGAVVSQSQVAGRVGG